MTNTVGFRPQLLPPQGRQLERSRRPLATCLTVSGCITVLVCVVFGLTAFNIYSHRYRLTEHRYHAGDEMSLRQASLDLSPTFCSAYSVHPVGWTEFYLMSHEAELDPTQQANISFRLTAPPPHYVKRVHYLPTNSTVRLSACYETLTPDPVGEGEGDQPLPAMFLVIVGDRHFQEWLKRFNIRHARYSIRIPRNATCSRPATIPTLTLTVPSSDNYHFVLLPRGTPVAPVPTPHVDAHTVPLPRPGPRLEADNGSLTLTGDISKTQFDLAGALAVCNASENSCRFPLEWGTHPDVVAKIRPDPQKPDADVAFFTACGERLEFWIPVFGGAPAVIVVLMWVWCWWLLVRKRDLRSRYLLRQASQEACRDYGSVREERNTLTAETPQLEERPEEEHEERCASIQG